MYVVYFVKIELCNPEIQLCFSEPLKTNRDGRELKGQPLRYIHIYKIIIKILQDFEYLEITLVLLRLIRATVNPAFCYQVEIIRCNIFVVKPT